MAFGLLICHFLLYSFNMEMKFWFVSFPWWYLWKSCLVVSSREKEWKQANHVWRAVSNWQHFLTEDDKLMESQDFSCGRYNVGASSGGYFDIAIVTEVRKRVRLGNENRRGVLRLSWKCLTQKPWRNIIPLNSPWSLLYLLVSVLQRNGTYVCV